LWISKEPAALFERTAQKEKTSRRIITQNIRRRKNLPFLDIIPTAPEKKQVHRRKNLQGHRKNRPASPERNKNDPVWLFPEALYHEYD
jgi:hypothetical protein